MREPQQNFVSSWKYYPNFFEGLRSALPMYKEGPLAGTFKKARGNIRGNRLKLSQFKRFDTKVQISVAFYIFNIVYKEIKFCLLMASTYGKLVKVM